MGHVAPHACFLLALAAAGSSALGQAFNIDCGGILGTPPASSYGAAAGQPGYWNPTGRSGDLRDLGGNPTAAKYGTTSGGNVYAIPGASGDDKRLMETAYVMVPSDSVSITQLVPGKFDLYAYSWGGQVFGARTVGFTVITGNTYVGSLTFGPIWPGGQVEGVTYARIPIEVLDGPNFLTLSIGSGHDYDLLAGIQLVPIPAPGAPAAVLGAILIASRRRRG